MSKITNPRRLLILSPSSQSSSLIPPFLHSLTGSSVPPSSDASFAGYTTHAPLRIENKYYKAEIPIWVDEVSISESDSDPESTSTEGKSGAGVWKSEFLSDDAEVVRDAIGGVIICISNPESTTTETEIEDRDDVRALKDFLVQIGEVKSRVEDERDAMGDVAGLVVLVGSSPPLPSSGRGEIEDDGPLSPAWWEDQLSELGALFEVVAWDPKQERENETRNQFGGMRRIREVLETHDWTPSPGEDLEELLGTEEDGFGLEVNELEQEMLGLKMAIGDDPEGDEERVDGMESLMLRMQAIKDMSAELPENERKRFAAKAVGDIMKEI